MTSTRTLSLVATSHYRKNVLLLYKMCNCPVQSAGQNLHIRGHRTDGTVVLSRQLPPADDESRKSFERVATTTPSDDNIMRLTDVFSSIGGSLAKAIKTGLVSLVIAVREVESGYAQARSNELLELVRTFDVPTSRAQSTDYFGLALGKISRGNDPLEGDVGSTKFGALRLHVVRRSAYVGIVTAFKICRMRCLLHRSGILQTPK